MLDWGIDKDEDMLGGGINKDEIRQVRQVENRPSTNCFVKKK